ncbi:hypothetical protein SHAb15599_00055 [Acinetobacter phage SH-Ab 15599]|nr:hypothetical protein SHAb15599_00055 [Acinetobacter phage SH-Ab 15599]
MITFKCVRQPQVVLHEPVDSLNLFDKITFDCYFVNEFLKNNEYNLEVSMTENLKYVSFFVRNKINFDGMSIKLEGDRVICKHVYLKTNYNFSREGFYEFMQQEGIKSGAGYFEIVSDLIRAIK